MVLSHGKTIPESGHLTEGNLGRLSEPIELLSYDELSRPSKLISP